MDCFQKDDNAIWSLDCNYEASIQESLTTGPLLKSFNLQAKDATNTDFIFEIYEDGSVKKFSIFNLKKPISICIPIVFFLM